MLLSVLEDGFLVWSKEQKRLKGSEEVAERHSGHMLSPASNRWFSSQEALLYVSSAV